MFILSFAATSSLSVITIMSLWSRLGSPRLQSQSAAPGVVLIFWWTCNTFVFHGVAACFCFLISSLAVAKELIRRHDARQLVIINKYEHVNPLQNNSTRAKSIAHKHRPTSRRSRKAAALFFKPARFFLPFMPAASLAIALICTSLTRACADLPRRQVQEVFVRDKTGAVVTDLMCHVRSSCPLLCGFSRGACIEAWCDACRRWRCRGCPSAFILHQFVSESFKSFLRD